MCKYKAIDEWGTISLHDCRITSIHEDGDNIICRFAEGYWIVETNAQNPYKKTLGTNDNAQLTLINARCEKIMVDEKEMTWEEFCAYINIDAWEFECITEEHAHQKCIYYGWLWFNEEPFHRDCELHFNCQHVEYAWNDICEDRPW